MFRLTPSQSIYSFSCPNGLYLRISSYISLSFCIDILQWCDFFRYMLFNHFTHCLLCEIYHVFLLSLFLHEFVPLYFWWSVPPSDHIYYKICNCLLIILSLFLSFISLLYMIWCICQYILFIFLLIYSFFIFLFYILCKLFKLFEKYTQNIVFILCIYLLFILKIGKIRKID